MSTHCLPVAPPCGVLISADFAQWCAACLQAATPRSFRRASGPRRASGSKGDAQGGTLFDLLNDEDGDDAEDDGSQWKASPPPAAPRSKLGVESRPAAGVVDTGDRQHGASSSRSRSRGSPCDDRARCQADKAGRSPQPRSRSPTGRHRDSRCQQKLHCPPRVCTVSFTHACPLQCRIAMARVTRLFAAMACDHLTNMVSLFSACRAADRDRRQERRSRHGSQKRPAELHPEELRRQAAKRVAGSSPGVRQPDRHEQAHRKRPFEEAPPGVRQPDDRPSSDRQPGSRQHSEAQPDGRQRRDRHLDVRHAEAGSHREQEHRHRPERHARTDSHQRPERDRGAPRHSSRRGSIRSPVVVDAEALRVIAAQRLAEKLPASAEVTPSRVPPAHGTPPRAQAEQQLRTNGGRHASEVPPMQSLADWSPPGLGTPDPTHPAAAHTPAVGRFQQQELPLLPPPPGAAPQQQSQQPLGSQISSVLQRLLGSSSGAAGSQVQPSPDEIDVLHDDWMVAAAEKQQRAKLREAAQQQLAERAQSSTLPPPPPGLLPPPPPLLPTQVSELPTAAGLYDLLCAADLHDLGDACRALAVTRLWTVSDRLVVSLMQTKRTTNDSRRLQNGHRSAGNREHGGEAASGRGHAPERHSSRWGPEAGRSGDAGRDRHRDSGRRQTAPAGERLMLCMTLGGSWRASVSCLKRQSCLDPLFSTVSKHRGWFLRCRPAFVCGHRC